jgi:hypothetical protein
MTTNYSFCKQTSQSLQFFKGKPTDGISCVQQRGVDMIIYPQSVIFFGAVGTPSSIPDFPGLIKIFNFQFSNFKYIFKRPITKAFTPPHPLIKGKQTVLLCAEKTVFA